MMTGGLIQSCCTQNYRIEGEGKLVANYFLATQPLESDTIEGPFFVRGEFHTAFVSAANSIGLISSAYATSCESIYLNTLDKKSFQLTVDRTVIYETDTISPGENLLALTALERTINESSGWYRAEFNEGFIKKSHFQDGYHTFTMTGQTTDSIALEAQITVYLKL